MRKMAKSLGVLALVIAGNAAAQTAPATGSSPSGYTPRPGAADSIKTAEGDRDLRVAGERAARTARESEPDTRRRGRVVVASAGDLTVGAAVHDRSGVMLGQIESVDAGGVQLLTADGRRAKIPAEGFGKGRAGLLLDMTKRQFDDAVTASLAE